MFRMKDGFQRTGFKKQNKNGENGSGRVKRKQRAGGTLGERGKEEAGRVCAVSSVRG